MRPSLPQSWAGPAVAMGAHPCRWVVMAEVARWRQTGTQRSEEEKANPWWPRALGDPWRKYFVAAQALWKAQRGWGCALVESVIRSRGSKKHRELDLITITGLPKTLPKVWWTIFHHTFHKSLARIWVNDKWTRSLASHGYGKEINNQKWNCGMPNLWCGNVWQWTKHALKHYQPNPMKTVLHY
jgi:hypothetical protein